MAKAPRIGRVLIADDERDIVELVRIVLERAGYEVVTAREGDRALELAREHPPAICILDGAMPGLAGFEVLARLRAEGATAEVPVLMLTATVDEEREIRRHGVEPDGFMRKPFDNASLLSEVARLIG
ncbi:MAG: response regulator [Solirubrobacterales bacterium]|nr:response regulator [Solirubrobacterales bacterium]